MKSIWTKNLTTEEEVARFNSSLRSAQPVLDRLMELLDEKDKELDRSQKSLDAYENPNWAFKTAHKNGFASCLSQIKTLINLDQQKI